ncbi:class I SAM-dependent methyltransferase [Methanobacterium alcaliphilum]|uniref:class I SAM-dependent methyltransferase n=1 Tax=Methanobacterium alcaliphilum TaxID=392018 RepID=UPI00200AF4A6|nr:class I SAM-dependent methyltransferase [Methanobacterium alcaliphilum]MCK9152104.1 class I SAM-dependent methyltransferase [Methanobacterium alcaliphilum]
MKEFEKYVSKNMNILDVGCGYGRTLNELHHQGFINLTGMDFSQGMIDRGLKNYPDLNIFKNDEDTLPFPENEFDAVILIAVLTCTPDSHKQDQIVEEISRVLKDGGILYINDYSINTDKRNISRYQKFEDKYGTYGIFELPEGAILRHHTSEHVFRITKNFKQIVFEEMIYDTMNGNESKGFYYIGQLKKL